MKKEFMEEFKNPPAILGGAPFWAWNCKLDKEQLLKQIDYFKEMGMGGFTMHCRTGLDTTYLGDEYMELVKSCVEKAKEIGMKAYLYDEDRWPSGFGGGQVTKEEKYRSRYLVFRPEPQDSNLQGDGYVGSSSAASAQGNGKLLARYEVKLKDRYLSEYKKLDMDNISENPTMNSTKVSKENVKFGEETHIWYAYLEVNAPSPWFNNQTYVDTLNKEAIQCFIDTTHEKYLAAVGEEFGKTIPSIFTDEPQFVHKTTLGTALDKKPVVIPYTDSFEESYCCQYGESFLEYLPEIFWELPEGEISVTRYHYHDHLAELFATSYSDTLGDWCKGHGIALTGHMMSEPTLESQTSALGETMRHYRGFQIPGIDMLCDWREYSTAKQAQSATHQMGGKEITSELYGVTNWDFDFRGHKLQGDWQAALGVTHRVHHLSWVSMAGEAKRDYPASIFYQSPWYKEYKWMEDYFTRVNVAMTSGNPQVKIGVIHPVESYWIHFGPKEQTSEVRSQLENQFEQMIEWLLFGLQDFDFICESTMTDMCEVEETPLFSVGEMQYQVVLVPGCHMLRETTCERLEAFCRGGGKVIFMGEAPDFMDGNKSELPRRLAESCINIPFNQIALLEALADYRIVDMKSPDGIRSSNYLYQMREGEGEKWLFIANGKKEENKDVPKKEDYLIQLKGSYQLEYLDGFTGEAIKAESFIQDGDTYMNHGFYEEDSLLLHLVEMNCDEDKSCDVEIKEEDIKDECVIEIIKKDKDESNNIIEVVDKTNSTTNDSLINNIQPIILGTVSDYHLSEPNVFMLDQAVFSLDSEPFSEKEEVLRIDNILRTRLGYPLKMEALAQPWVNDNKKKAEHQLTLQYTFQSSIDVKEVKLGSEFPADAQIVWNGTVIENTCSGYFVDECIQSISLGGMKAGVQNLVVTLPYSAETNLEWCYLLGEFGVQVVGNYGVIIPKAETIGFGDATVQTLPFYAGNITYDCQIEVGEGEYEIEISKYRAPLLSVSVDGERKGIIAFSPYRLPLGKLSGKHTIQITAYGSRVNAFGAVHNCDDSTTWFGPPAWRTEGNQYCYEYMLKKTGVLTAPKLWKVNK